MARHTDPIEKDVPPITPENGNGNGRVTWRQLERYIGFGVLLVSIIFSFADLKFRVDTLVRDLQAHIMTREKQIDKNIYTHSMIGMAKRCDTCMSGRPK